MPGLVFPLESRAAWYLLVEVASTSARVPLDEILQDVLEWGMTEGLVSDGALATSEAQRTAFWRLREEQPEGQRLERAQLKHDVSAPPGRVADFALRLARLADGMGGSFAAEHGLGRSKIALADALRDAVERDLMARLKRAFDADGGMNPGVILSEDRQA